MNRDGNKWGGITTDPELDAGQLSNNFDGMGSSSEDTLDQTYAT